MGLGKGAVLLVAATALSLQGCSWFTPIQGHLVSSRAPTRKATPVPPTTIEDEMFLASSLAHVNSQLELARMAEQKAKTPSLIAYAKNVASERAGLADKLAAAAQEDGVGSDVQKAPRLDDFTPLKGEAFERAYVAAQIEDQQNNLDSFSFEAANGSSAELKSLAAAEVPRLQNDLTQATAIVKDLPFTESGTEDMDTPGMSESGTDTLTDTPPDPLPAH